MSKWVEWSAQTAESQRKGDWSDISDGRRPRGPVPCTLSLMSIRNVYFAATSDEEAKSTIDLRAGPGGGAHLPVPKTSRGMFRRHTTAVSGATRPDMEEVDFSWVDPFVCMGTLEELVTGASYDEIAEMPRLGMVIAVDEDETRIVCTVTDSLLDALALASDGQLISTVGKWVETDEFRLNGAKARDVLPLLRQLASLASQARNRHQRLYCWGCQ